MRLILALSVFTGCFFILSWVLPIIIRTYIEAGIREAVLWTPHSPSDVDARYRYTNSTANTPYIIQFWLFNVTNVPEIRQGAKPNLQEVGPFTYLKNRIKIDVWWDKSGRVSFKELSYHVLLPEQTTGGEEDVITTLNIPLIGVLEAIHAMHLSPSFQHIFTLAIEFIAKWQDGRVNGIFTNRTVKELLWGYEDQLLVSLAKVLGKGLVSTTRFELVHNMSSVAEAQAQPASVYDSGANNLSRLWTVELDRGLRKLQVWNSCMEVVGGSDGMQFHPWIAADEKLQVWVPDLMRQVALIPSDDVILDGIRLRRYNQDDAASDIDPCHFQTIRGLMNITYPHAVGPFGNGSAPGPPIYVSSPHFCAADPQLAENVTGLSCDANKHVTYVDVEPMTGTTMRAHKRSMVSTGMPDTWGRQVEPRINSSFVLPVVWFDEGASVSPQMVDYFKRTAYRALHFENISQSLCGGLGLALLMMTCFALFQHLQHGATPPEIEGSSSALKPEPGGSDLRAELLQHDQEQGSEINGNG